MRGVLQAGLGMRLMVELGAAYLVSWVAPIEHQGVVDRKLRAAPVLMQVWLAGLDWELAAVKIQVMPSRVAVVVAVGMAVVPEVMKAEEEVEALAI